MDYESIAEEMKTRMEGCTDSRQPTGDEVTICWLVGEVERLRLNEPRKLIEELIYTIRTVHLDMGGNHKYALSHQSHGIISRITAYLSS